MGWFGSTIEGRETDVSTAVVGSAEASCSLVLIGKSREENRRFDAPGLGCATEHWKEVAEPEDF